jgi:hypothetical protein
MHLKFQTLKAVKPCITDAPTPNMKRETKFQCLKQVKTETFPGRTASHMVSWLMLRFPTTRRKRRTGCTPSQSYRLARCKISYMPCRLTADARYNRRNLASPQRKISSIHPKRLTNTPRNYAVFRSESSIRFGESLVKLSKQ